MENNTDVQVTENVEKETTQKTYTVEDVNNSFNAGVKKAHADLQKDDNYKQFLNWQKNNQNDGEKIKNLESEIANIKNENAQLKVSIKMKDSNVKPEFTEFVTSKVMSMMNETTNFDEALKTLKKDAPQYFGETVVKKVQTGPSMQNGQQPQNTNEIMNNFIRNG